jgi:signal peptidase II
MERSSDAAPGSRRALFWGVSLLIVALDVVTKRWAEGTLTRFPREVIGEGVRFSLVYNPGAAFGAHLGPYSRVIFGVLTVAALVVLFRLYQATRGGDWTRLLALGLVCGGAVGNLIDRVRSPMGVVDFIDVGFGEHRWPTFNVADMGVSVGAMLLAWVLWGEDQQAAAQMAAQSAVIAPSEPGTPPSGAQ